MNEPITESLFWACIGPDDFNKEFETLPKEIRKAFRTDEPFVVHEDTKLHFVFFPTAQSYGLGLPIPGFTLERGFTIAKLASESATVRGNVIRILESLGVKEAGKLVEIFGIGPEPQQT